MGNIDAVVRDGDREQRYRLLWDGEGTLSSRIPAVGSTSLPTAQDSFAWKGVHRERPNETILLRAIALQ
ncbi:hypothetical protein [Nocardia sp. CY41]|uniref:hypothetical protein n=1 Tax=Nocardia sp. CY41 TaxID=2608686 RepID=UPI00135CAC98|nr:hypothetical protein [Nocardia sp. CY41]